MALADFRCHDFTRLLASREAHHPMSDRSIKEVHDSPDKTGRDERKHMVVWFADNETRGAGAYSRAEGNASVRRCYARLQNVASLLRIAEAVAISEEQLPRAYGKAVAAGDRQRACGTIYRAIP